jgi:hypothetical protein
LFNGTDLRLVYAPRGESSGYMTFNVGEMATVAGRPMFAALHMLLSAERVFGIGMADPKKQSLAGILADSRKYQSLVSTKLAEQVLAALYELLRGFQAADDQRHGELLHEVLAEDPNHVYAGLLTVLMRLVFILYAEDRGLLSNDPLYVNHYSVTGLFERLRADASRYPDTMDQRYGAWAQLLTLFRLIYEGGRHGEFQIRPRHGYLFDPDRYNFLEGRPWKMPRHLAEKTEVPQVPDGVVFRVLRNLLVLDGERLSYRTLDVEQIGSVYEAVMGFNLQVAEGRSIAVRAAKAHGAPSTINLEALLTCKPAQRAKWLRDHAEQKLAGQPATALKQAETIEDLLAALERRIAKKVTPNVVAKGTMVLQPSDERRRSGSHYTPRSLTEPIVQKALEPVLANLPSPARGRGAGGEGTPTPDQILDLKICDPAMGSGAFLVAACRQLGDELIRAWHVHDCVPKLPPDEDEVLHARRLVAQRCLYGVDKNPMAVDLAKLSLWLATLAKDHPFTFLDHSLRCGDSLVGLSREQIAGFHWERKKQRDLFLQEIRERMQRVTEYRRKILAAREDVPYDQLRQQLDVADEQLDLARLAGDLVISAFFSAGKDRQRKARLEELEPQLAQYLSAQGKMQHRQPLAAAIRELQRREFPVQPFHWQIEFPEVFDRENGGFDCIVGNPPFLGGTMISTANGSSYKEWLYSSYEESGNRMDLVAYFFRRSFRLQRKESTFGLVGTNTIAQGDTRQGGLAYICGHGGTIYGARRRMRWPGAAAVIVSVIHVARGSVPAVPELDGRRVEKLTAYLFHRGGHDSPAALASNRGLVFEGTKPYGQGFLFDDNDPKASSLEDYEELVRANPRNAEIIQPYLGGEEVNASPTHEHSRYIISFGEMSEQEARLWPRLLAIVEQKVKPERQTKSADVAKTPWWQFFRVRAELYARISQMQRTLACSRHQPHWCVTFLPTGTVFSEALVIFAFDTESPFAVLQSGVHETWARFFGSSIKDDLRYTPSDCFETFPFPESFESNSTLRRIGREYYEFRADLMVRNDEGLTKTYNRFHDPDERSADIVKLRKLHDAMDRAVLDTYGWTDIRPTCEFLLDYEEEEDEDEPGARKSKRKKPWRYRWPDDIRDEVLARLLDLNQKRAEEERLAGVTADAAEKKRTKRKGRARKKKSNPNQQKMFGD